MESFTTDIPARLDRLPFARFHWLVVVALGIAWVLDGLEVTLVGALSGAIAHSSLHLTDVQIGDAASFYLLGAVGGALGFGWLADRLGRKRLFSITVLLYLLATIGSGMAWNFLSFALLRGLTGAGIGGEYAAVNAAIQELIPARRRGFTDLVVNGSFWLGAALGAGGAVLALNPAILPATIGWRVAFIAGGAIGLVTLLLRRFVPESPRWLMTHGHPEAAEATMQEIEQRVAAQTGVLPPVPAGRKLRLRTDRKSWFGAGLRALVTQYRRRTLLGVVLMAAQAFCYNAVFFTYALILISFYHVDSGRVGLFILPFAVGNFAGPLLLGRLFDSLGRRLMITATYMVAGALLIGTGWLFAMGWLDATGQMLAWTATFFVASAAASAALLTVGESFPLEVRGVAIGLFYAFGTALGGVAGPAIFGRLIATGSRDAVFAGYGLGGGLMLVAGLVEIWLGPASEGQGLEQVAPPLSAVAEDAP